MFQITCPVELDAPLFWKRHTSPPRPQAIAVAVCCTAIALHAHGPLAVEASSTLLAAASNEQPAGKPGADDADGAAAEDGSPDDPPVEAGSVPTDQGTGDTPDESGAAEDESEEVFVPSEDISEDIDVPFPVDI